MVVNGKLKGRHRGLSEVFPSHYSGMPRKTTTEISLSITSIRIDRDLNPRPPYHEAESRHSVPLETTSVIPKLGFTRVILLVRGLFSAFKKAQMEIVLLILLHNNPVFWYTVLLTAFFPYVSRHCWRRAIRDTLLCPTLTWITNNYGSVVITWKKR
jgi:hypothetical protein